MSVLPHVALVVSVQLAIGPLVVWNVRIKQQPSRAEWEHVAKELPSKVWTQLLGEE